MKKQHGFLRAVSMGLSVCLLCGALAVPSFADNSKQQQLEQQKKELQTQLEQEKAELKNIQSTKTAAQKNKKSLENQSNLIKSADRSDHRHQRSGGTQAAAGGRKAGRDRPALGRF